MRLSILTMLLLRDLGDVQSNIAMELAGPLPMPCAFYARKGTIIFRPYHA